MAAVRLTHEDIIRNVRAGKIAPIYYLMGEEDYYIDKLSEFLITTLLQPEEKDFNLDILYGAECSITQVIEMAQAYPMMAERRVILVREAQMLRSLEGLDAYLQHLTPTTVIIFCHKHGTLDARKSVSKEIQKVGVMYESKRLYENQLAPFISNYAQRKGVQMEEQAIQMLADHVGADLCRLSSEIEKLLLTLPADTKRITATMVEQQTGVSKDFNDFELQAALAVRDVLKANRIVKYYQSNPRSFALQRTLTNLFTFFSDVMMAF